MTTDKHNKRPNVPPLRFPEFTDEWKTYKVSDVLDFYSTNSLSWDQLEYSDGELRNLHYGLIHVGLPTLVNLKDDLLPTIKEGNTPKNYTLCLNGDVAFADASEDTNDVAKAIELVETDGNKVVFGLHTIHGRDNKGLTTLGFKGYAFSSKVFHDQIKCIAQGTKIYSISSKNFTECYIGIPSKAEQSKIARLLSLLDRRIAAQSGLIEKLESLISGITLIISKSDDCEFIRLSEILTERNEVNTAQYEVYSVSVSQGVVNQVDYLGRSFAAKDTSNYNVVHYGDIVYTKSPTGDFPYGIVKRSGQTDPVAVSPLYGVYKPASNEIGCFLHYYFCNPVSAKNYLHKLIQKGAKNTINITNQRFLENTIKVPKAEKLTIVVKLLNQISAKKQHAEELLTYYRKQKRYFLSQMFI